MGAWGAGSFHNDAALDWIADLVDAQDVALVAAALAEVGELGDTGYLDADVACYALAAAEVVAATLGRPMAAPPEPLAAWLAEGRLIDCALVVVALQALARIRARSELRDLWLDTATSGEWLAAVGELETRLRALP